MKDLPRLDKRKDTLVMLVGMAADPLWPHPCDDDRRLAVAYLSKRLRRQGQTEGALPNTKVSLVFILKNATFF